MDLTIDLSTISADDVKEEYVLLKKAYVQLRVASENDAQRIHELKRSLDTALAAQEYMMQELEQCSNNNDNEQVAKLHGEVEELKRKYVNLQETHKTLQQFAEQTTQENERLTASVKELKSVELAKKSVEETEIEAQVALQRTERLRNLEEENLELLQKLNELHDENVQLQMAINDKENAVETMRDRLQCLEENLRCKRDELEEKSEMLESAQEQLCEANAKIALLTTAPENEERKGNSLFAEVDDQRQQMKHLLAAQKRSYLDMKKIYNESQYEIRRLKNENIAMHNEMEACTTLFASTNKSYQDKLLERLKHATNEKERVENQLKLMHERLIDLGNQKGVNWLDSILSYCKKETEDLKQELRSARRGQASVEEQLRNTSQQMACWRFEALKTRCVLLDRENLLNNNNIKFKPKTAIEFCMKEEEQLSAKPRIISTRRASLTNVKQEEDKDIQIKSEITTNVAIQEEKTDSPAIINNLELQENLVVNKIVEKIIVKEQPLDINDNKENTVLNVIDKKNRTSISTKARCLLAKEEKSVTFSAASPLVHKYMENEEEQELTKSKAIKTTVTKIPSKSGVVIMRNLVFKKPTK